MDKNKAAALGNQVLENTLKVIMAMPEDEKMVMLTGEVLTKKEIIDKFWKDEKFAWEMAENFDKTVKSYLSRTNFGKKMRRQKLRPGNG